MTDHNAIAKLIDSQWSSIQANCNTWGSNLTFHPHLHCIVPGGGITLKNQWKNAKGKGKFLFPVKALSKVFRGKFVHQLKHFLDYQGMEYTPHLHQQLYAKPWVVYAKPPFGGPGGVIQYLARYTHNIAISNHRIIHYNKHSVQFSYTDYRHANQQKTMTLSAWEFVRRYALHILPKGFTRIRHFGILSSAWKNKIFPQTANKKNANWIQFWKAKGLNIHQCPFCKKGALLWIIELKPARPPPLLSTNYTT
jgi:hypothetical protein